MELAPQHVQALLHRDQGAAEAAGDVLDAQGIAVAQADQLAGVGRQAFEAALQGAQALVLALIAGEQSLLLGLGDGRRDQALAPALARYGLETVESL